MSGASACGYAGGVLFVDLSTGQAYTEPLEEAWRSESLGGFGINLRLWERVARPGCDPLAPGNPIILGAGPLVGTLAPGASRVMATSRFPLTGAVATASGAMGLGAMLKWAGYDQVVISGKADSLSYLLIEDGKVEVRSATGLEGLGTGEIADRLYELHPGCSATCIGPAGENLVSSAIAIIDKSSTLGRGGLGAVMGAKNLKAIAVRGTGGIRLAEPARFLRSVDGLHERLRAWPRRERTVELGMMAAYPGLEGPYLQVKRGRHACPSCFVGDKDTLGIESGEPQLRRSPCTSYLNAMLLGIMLDLDVAEQVEILNVLDHLGLCFITFMNMALFLRDLLAHGLAAPDGLGLATVPDAAFPNALELARALASRTGIGAVLAGGWGAAVDYFGPESAAFAITVKGQDCLYDPRISGLGTMEFEQIVSPRGPTSASSGSPTYSPGTPLEDFPRHAARMGAPPDAVERICDGGQLNVARLTRYSEDWFSLFSSLGICNRAQNNRFYNIEVIGELFASATGLELGPRELMARAADTWKLYVELNRREGFSEADDVAPAQWFNPDEVWKRSGRMEDYFHAHEITPADMEQLIRDYRDERSR